MTRVRLIVGFLLLGAAGLCRAQPYIISTYAGGGPPATPAPALHMWFGNASALAAGAAGNLYFASLSLNCVFKMDANGIVTRLAGTSLPGYSGDGGPAISAQLSRPIGLAVDAAENVYVADSGNNRIRKITPDGVITTVAGNGTYGSSGDGGPATAAQLGDAGGYWAPGEVAVDRLGNLFVLDSGRIRKVSPDGIISTFVQNVFGPIAVDSAGNLFCRGAKNTIIKVSPDGLVTPVAGGPEPSGAVSFPGVSKTACVDDLSGDGGPATQTGLCAPVSLAVDASGNVFISEDWLYDEAGEIYSGAIRKVSPDGTITTVAGGKSSNGYYEGGPATAFPLSGVGVAVDSAGNLLINLGNSIRQVSSDGTIHTVAGYVPDPSGDLVWEALKTSTGDGGPAASARFDQPCSVAVDSSGNLFIGDCLNHRVRRVSNDGIVTSVAGTGRSGYSGDGGLATNAQIGYPAGLALDNAGNLFILDNSANCVRKVSPDGIIVTVAGNGTPGFSGDGGPAVKAQLSYVTGVAVDSAGNLYIADGGNSRVRKVSTAGIITTVAGNGINGFSGDGGPATKAQLQGPVGVAVDSAGNLFILSGRIRKVSPAGIITTIAGNGRGGPLGDGGPAIDAGLLAYWIAVDGSGNLFTTSGGYAGRVQKISVNGIVNTVAGTGASGYSGDGGLATDALLSNPTGVAVDSSGNVYVADTNNGVIRILRPI